MSGFRKDAPPSYDAAVSREQGGEPTPTATTSPPAASEPMIYFDSNGLPYEVHGDKIVYLDGEAGSLGSSSGPDSAKTGAAAPSSSSPHTPLNAAGARPGGSFTDPANGYSPHHDVEMSARGHSPAPALAASAPSANNNGSGGYSAYQPAAGEVDPREDHSRWGDVDVEEQQRSSRVAHVGVAISLLAVQNPAFFLVLSFLYNFPQVIAYAVVLGLDWDSAKTCRYHLAAWLAVNTALRVWNVLVSAHKYNAIIRNGMSPLMYEMSGMNKFHKIVHLFNTVWFIVGAVWIFNEDRCDHIGTGTGANPVYTTCVAAFVLMVVNFMLPCLLLCLLIPLVCCCAPCIIRLLVGLQSEEVRARDPTRAKIDELPISRYQAPPAAPAPAGAAAGANENRETCSICIVDFEDGEAIKVLPCPGMHKFHVECIDNWLKINPTCCMCRQPVFDGNGDPLPMPQPQQHRAQVAV